MKSLKLGASILGEIIFESLLILRLHIENLNCFKCKHKIISRVWSFDTPAARFTGYYVVCMECSKDIPYHFDMELGEYTPIDQAKDRLKTRILEWRLYVRRIGNNGNTDPFSRNSSHARLQEDREERSYTQDAYNKG